MALDVLVRSFPMDMATTLPNDISQVGKLTWERWAKGVVVAALVAALYLEVIAEPDLRGLRLTGLACFSCWPAIWRPNFSWRVSRLCRYWWGLHGLSGVSAA